MERFAKWLNVGILSFILLVVVTDVGDRIWQGSLLRFSEGKIVFVSPIQLIATPEKFNGQKIFTVGYLVLEEENNRLYISEESALHSTYNAVDVSFLDTTIPKSDIKKFNRTWVELNGTFHTIGWPQWAMAALLRDHNPQIREITSVRLRANSPPQISVVPGLGVQ